ncbi:MAG: hypothetical protein P0Y59_14905 [Candidatus Sphingomonas phytovorans]|nr:hypothetical protein [Sphingomonas sp.]WEJ98231.1 MAG: hypothetical protein P0Y59_14905 [Sphingomonas sp.]
MRRRIQARRSERDQPGLFYRVFSNDYDNYFIIVSSGTAKSCGKNGTIIGTIGKSSSDPDLLTFLPHEQRRTIPRRGATYAAIKQFPARSGRDFRRNRASLADRRSAETCQRTIRRWKNARLA